MPGQLESVDMRSYKSLLSRLEMAAESPYIRIEHIGSYQAAGRSYPMVVVHLGTPHPEKLSVLISAGIHGDEPAGVEATMRFIEINADNPMLLSHYNFTIFPCDNPYGWERNIRENYQGLDLNRQFNTANPSPEVKIIAAALEGKKFDLVYEMHEDCDSPGFYLYEFGDDPNHYIGDMIIHEVESFGFPINRGHIIERRKAKNGIIRLNMETYRRTRLPKSFYAYRRWGGQVLTLEPPSSALSIEDRVRIELLGLNVSLNHAWRRRMKYSVPVQWN